MIARAKHKARNGEQKTKIYGKTKGTIELKDVY